MIQDTIMLNQSHEQQQIYEQKQSPYESKSNRKFNQYLHKKVHIIQQTKKSTIKIADQYFSEIQEKITKYILREKKKVLISYEDNINNSLNCLNHNFLYNSKNQQILHGKNSQKPNKHNITKNSQKINHQPHKNEQHQNHNQLTIKLQIKKLLEQMLLSQNHINQSIKLIGDGIKNQVQKKISPLIEIFQKIPTLTKLQENKMTVLIKGSPESKFFGNKTSNKNHNKRKQSNGVIEATNSEIGQRTKLLLFNNEKLNTDIYPIKMTQKLIRKSSVITEQQLLLLDINKSSNKNKKMPSYNTSKLHLKPIPFKQSQICKKIKQQLSIQSLKLTKNTKTKQLQFKTITNRQLAFIDFINNKSFLQIYKNKLIKNNYTNSLSTNQNIRLQQNQQLNIHNVQQQVIEYEIILNDKVLNEGYDNSSKKGLVVWEGNNGGVVDLNLEQEGKFVYEAYSKIQFDSKPNREYLLLLSSVIQTINQRMYKSYKMSLYNYKGQLITQNYLGKYFTTYHPQEILVSIEQMTYHSSLMEYVYFIFSNRIVRMSLKNFGEKKEKFYSLSQEKLIRCEKNSDRLIVFQGRKMVIQILSFDLLLLQSFNWTNFYPNQIRLNMFYTISIYHANQQTHVKSPINKQQSTTKTLPTNSITFIIPNQPINSVLYYISNGFIKTMKLQYKPVFQKASQTCKKRFHSIQTIQKMVQIQQNMYIVLSKRFQQQAVGSTRWKCQYDIFLLELIVENAIDSNSVLKIQQRTLQIQNRKDLTIKSEQSSSLQSTSDIVNKVIYIDTIKQQIEQIKYFQNQFVIMLKCGKVTTYSLY